MPIEDILCKVSAIVWLTHWIFLIKDGDQFTYPKKSESYYESFNRAMRRLGISIFTLGNIAVFILRKNVKDNPGTLTSTLKKMGKQSVCLLNEEHVEQVSPNYLKRLLSRVLNLPNVPFVGPGTFPTEKDLRPKPSKFTQRAAAQSTIHDVNIMQQETNYLPTKPPDTPMADSPETYSRWSPQSIQYAPAIDDDIKSLESTASNVPLTLNLNLDIDEVVNKLQPSTLVYERKLPESWCLNDDYNVECFSRIEELKSPYDLMEIEKGGDYEEAHPCSVDIFGYQQDAQKTCLNTEVLTTDTLNN